MSSILKELRNIAISINVFFLMLMILQTYNLDSITVHIALTDAIEFDIITNVWLIITSIAITLLLTALSGIQVLGTGLSDESVKTFIKVVSAIVVWVISSMGLYFVLTGINIIFMNTLVIFLTLFYALGFIDNAEGS